MRQSVEKILLVLIMISMISGSVVLIQRIQVEERLDRVDVYLDYFEVNELARQSSQDVDWWLRFFQRLGATHVVLEEESLGLMRQALKPIRVEVGLDVLKEWNWQRSAPPVLSAYHESVGIRDHDVVVMTEDDLLYRQIVDGIQSRYAADRFTLLPGVDGSVIILHGNLEDAVYYPPADLTDFEGGNYFRERRLHSSQLTRLGLGFDAEKIRRIQQAGLLVMPRPFSYKDWGGETYLRGYLQDLEHWEMIPDILFFGGRQLPGSPDDSLWLLETFMKENGIHVGLLETSFQRGHLEQEGIEELTASLNYQAVRVFNVWPFVQERYRFYHYEGAEEIENTLYRAVTERNIRMIYFKPFKESTTVYVTDPAEYERIFNRFESRIARHGLQLGSASVFPETYPGTLWQLLMLPGIAAAGVFLIRKALPIPEWWCWVLLGAVLIPMAGLLVVRPGWGEKLAALVAAIVFPSLAMWVFCHSSWQWLLRSPRLSFREAVMKGVWLMLKMSLVSGMGALMVAALLSDVRYLLEMDIFRGVKISQLIPIALYGIVFLHFVGYKRHPSKLDDPGIRPSEIRELLLENIKVLYVAALGVLLVAGYVYLARTGHEGNLQPMEIEMIIRNVLEEKLLVRPRTKEFTVAFPALVLGAYLASLKYKSLIFISGLAAVIGQTSIVNTFSHLRTPVVVSAIRTLYSLIASIGVAMVYLVLLMGLVMVIERWGKMAWQHLEKSS